MSIAMQIHHIAEKLNATEQTLILELMKRLLPDDVATSEDLQDIKLARQELASGDAIDFNDIDW